MSGALIGPEDIRERLAKAGIRTVADVMSHSECIRDLPTRSNHVLVADGLHIHVKRTKKGRRPREAHAIEIARAARVPTAVVAFRGSDPRHGAVTGTLDLAPARPFDELLLEGALGRWQIRRTFEVLADAVATLHDAKRNHRDLYLCHVFVRFEGRKPKIALIDLERLRKHRRLLGPRVVKDLAAVVASIPEGSVPGQQAARFLLRYMVRRDIPRRGIYPGLMRRVRARPRASAATSRAPRWGRPPDLQRAIDEARHPARPPRRHPRWRRGAHVGARAARGAARRRRGVCDVLRAGGRGA